MIITAFSYLQRLRIEVEYTDGLPSFPPASSRLLLPHLWRLEIWSTSYSTIDASSFFLEALSGWKLPSLQYLDISSYGEKHHYADALIGFIASHRDVLRYLDLWYPSTECLMSPDTVTTIFTLCTNLRSINVYLEKIPAFDLLPAHPNLEKLYTVIGASLAH
jgi:hypothetical protein